MALSPQDRQRIEAVIDDAITRSQNVNRGIVATRQFESATVGASPERVQFADIVRQVASGEQGTAQAYAREMIDAVKRVEAVPNISSSEFTRAATTIIDDIMGFVERNPVLSRFDKLTVEETANELRNYVTARGQLSTRIKRKASGLISRARGGISEGLSESSDPLVRILGGLFVPRGKEKTARSKSLAGIRAETSQSASRLTNTGEEYESSLNRMKWSEGSSSNTMLSYQKDIRDDIRALRIGEEQRGKAEADRANDMLDAQEVAAEAGQDVYSGNNKFLNAGTSVDSNGMLSKLTDLFPKKNIFSALIEQFSGVMGVVRTFRAFMTFMGFGSAASIAMVLAGVLASAAYAAMIGGIVRMALSAFRLRRDAEKAGLAETAKREINTLKEEGVDMSFIPETGTDTETMARAVANTRLTKNMITKDEWGKFDQLGGTRPKEGNGFTDKDALIYLRTRNEIQNEKLTGQTGAASDINVALRGGTNKLLRDAERKDQQRLSRQSQGFGANIGSFVSGGEVDLSEYAVLESRQPPNVTVPSVAPAAVSPRRSGTPSTTTPTRDVVTTDVVYDAISKAAAATGMDVNQLLQIAWVESSFNPTAQPKGTSAKGLFQFIDSTWNAVIQKYKDMYPALANADVFDPYANALAGALFIRDNQKEMGTSESGLSYLAHFAGARGAKKLLRADAERSAASVLPDAAKYNPSIFKTKEGRERTVGEVRDLLTSRVLNAPVASRSAGPVSAGTSQLAAAQNMMPALVIAKSQPVVAATTTQVHLPYAVRPRDESIQALNSVNAF